MALPLGSRGSCWSSTHEPSWSITINTTSLGATVACDGGPGAGEVFLAVGSAWGFVVEHPDTTTIAAAMEVARSRRAVPIGFIVTRAT
jgi:hypothetical protein